MATEISDAAALRIAELERENADLRMMLENLPEGVMALDAKQRFLFANPSVCRLLGLGSQVDAGERLDELIQHPDLEEAVIATFASREPYESEFAMHQPPRIFEFRGKSVRLADGRAIVAVMHDMTELRRLELVRQEFFANVSHELKTPLTAIKAFTETLLDGGDTVDPAISRRFLKRIEEQSDRLYRLVIDMLMLARTESKEPGFVLQRLDARETARTVVESFRADAEIKGVALSLDSSQPPCWVSVDPEGLLVIAKNLVDNALKYTPSGGRITVSVWPDDGWVAFAVADTGVGIPAADLGRVFERFYRVDKARSRELGGTGLGLSIVKHLSQTFGGTVSVASGLGEGSTFTVRLPRLAVAET